MPKKESPQFLSRRDFLQLSGASLVAFLASCGPTEIFEPTITPTQAEPSPTEVIEPTPTIKPTSTKEPTSTVEPSPTPEPLPRNFADPELQAEILEEFMARPENQKYSSIEEVLIDFEKRSNYKGGVTYSGLGKYSHWMMARRYLVIGVADISVGHLEGMSPEAKVKSLFYVHPNEPDVFMSSVIGLNEFGKWGVATYILIGPGEVLDIAADEFDEWANGLVNKTLGIGNLLYFREQGDWNSQEWYLSGNPYLKKLIETPGSYIQKFTKDPASYLGNKLSTGRKVGGHSVTSLSDLMEQLDPKVDSGGLLVVHIRPW